MNAVTPQAFAAQAVTAVGQGLLARPQVRDELLPRLVERTKLLADARTKSLVVAALNVAREQLTREASRLRELQKVNQAVRDEEIQLMVAQLAELESCIETARLRLDSVRLIYRGPTRIDN